MFTAIYIDTSVFFNCKFEFDDGPLKELGEHCFRHGIQLWSSDIALTELDVVIKERIEDIVRAVNRAQPILKNANSCYDLGIVDLSQVANEVRDVARNFFHNQEVVILRVDSLDESDISGVFRDYFNKRGCFSNRSKKSEFPDAFQVAMILRAARCGQKVGVLSSDKDFQRAFDQIPDIEVFASHMDLIKMLREL